MRQELFTASRGEGAQVEGRWWFFWFLVAAVAAYFVYAFWASPLRNKTDGESAKVSS
jgi:hypothetical protein